MNKGRGGNYEEAISNKLKKVQIAYGGSQGEAKLHHYAEGWVRTLWPLLEG